MKKYRIVINHGRYIETVEGLLQMKVSILCGLISWWETEYFFRGNTFEVSRRIYHWMHRLNLTENDIIDNTVEVNA